VEVRTGNERNWAREVANLLLERKCDIKYKLYYKNNSLVLLVAYVKALLSDGDSF
jgi:hypothetical protein